MIAPDRLTPGQIQQLRTQLNRVLNHDGDWRYELESLTRKAISLTGEALDQPTGDGRLLMSLAAATE